MKLTIYAVFISFLLFTLSCTKEEDSTNEVLIGFNSDSARQVDAIRLFIDSVSKIYTSSSGKQNIIELSNSVQYDKIQGIDFTDNITLIFAPLNKGFTSSIKTRKETSKYLAIAIIKNKNLIDGEIVEILESSGGLILTKETIISLYSRNDLTAYSGIVFFSNVNKQYKRELEYVGGELTFHRSIGIGTGNGSVNQTPIHITLQSSGCIDWYLETYYNGQLISEQYLYTTCPGSSIYDCQMTRSVGGTGLFEKSCGGGGGEEYAGQENINSTLDICPRSFKYQVLNQPDQYGGGWQVAAVTGIRMRIVDQNVNIELPLPTYFLQLPVVRSNGEYYDADKAAQITSDAIEIAERKVFQLYRSGLTDQSTLLVEYKKLINKELEAFGGKASQIAPTGLNAQTTKAVYGIFGLDYFCW